MPDTVSLTAWRHSKHLCQQTRCDGIQRCFQHEIQLNSPSTCVWATLLAAQNRWQHRSPLHCMSTDSVRTSVWTPYCSAVQQRQHHFLALHVVTARVKAAGNINQKYCSLHAVLLQRRLLPSHCAQLSLFLITCTLFTYCSDPQEHAPHTPRDLLPHCFASADPPNCHRPMSCFLPCSRHLSLPVPFLLTPVRLDRG